MARHCEHHLCPTCQEAEIRRLRALLDAEASRAAQLDKAVRRLEREIGDRVKRPLPTPKRP